MFLREARSSTTQASQRISRSGLGPYKIEEFNAGNYVSTVKNPDFYFGEPHIDRYVFKVLPDVNSTGGPTPYGELTFATIEPANVSSLQGGLQLSD